jgi:hypothetical protein
MWGETKPAGNRSNEPVSDRVAINLKALIDLSLPASSLMLPHSSRHADNSGGYLSKFKGRGMEFDETRLYQPGDDVRSIDWKVTARTGKAHTKIFREERERPVFISVDQRSAMHFATRGVYKSVLAAKLAGLLAWVSQQRGDRIGGQIFTDKECIELKPHSGKQGVLRFFNALVDVEREQHAHYFGLDQALSRLTHHTRPGSMVYLLSDFRGINNAAERHLAKLSQHCDVVLIFIFDTLECQLPAKGHYRFTDTIRDVIIDSGDQKFVTMYKNRFEKRLSSVQKLSKKVTITSLLARTSDDPVHLLRILGKGQQLHRAGDN